LDRCDGALLAALALAAALCTGNLGLLLNDGAVLLSVGWLGNAWDLYFNQIPGRAVSTLLAFGPAWAARWAFGLSSGVYIVLAHILWFAVPLCLWLVLRAVEPQRMFSRLYLAAVLALIYFPSELIVGIGLWMIWAAILADPSRSSRQVAIVTFLMAAMIAFTHPATGLMSVLYLTVGGALAAFGRPFPRRTLVAAAALSVLLLSAYLAINALFPSTNPTIATALAANRYDYLDPRWMLATLALFPMLAALWLLLLAPGANATGLRWRLSPAAVTTIAAVGLWFAAAGTGLLTWLFARHSGTHVLVVALALAVAAPAASWLAEARRPLMLYAMVVAVAFVSYNADLVLYGRFVDRYMAPGVVDVDALRSDPWPTPDVNPFGARIYFKWAADADYVRNVVVPDYGRYRIALAFYSFFRSDRRSVLFHQLTAGEWIPFECAPVERALARARDELDRQFLTFLSGPYCVR
jgi:hypothetical protein